MSRVHDALRRADVPKQPTEPVVSPAPPVSAQPPQQELPEEVIEAVETGVERMDQVAEPVAAAPVAETPVVETAPPEIVEAEVEVPAEADAEFVSEAVAEAHFETPAFVPPPPVAPPPPAAPVIRTSPGRRRAAARATEPPSPPPAQPLHTGYTNGVQEPPEARRTSLLPGLFGRVEVVPFNPSDDASLLDPARPHDGPIEEFRGIRTRLNHLQGQRPIKTVVVTSPSPAEGKSFTAANLAITQAQLEGNYVLLADFDFRRPVMHHMFQLERTPGMTDYLQGKVLLEQAIKRIEGTNLFVLPAGEVVTNPLELLNLPEAKRLIDYLGSLFRWVIIDTPPLLFAADANLLSTLCDGTVMVVRVGATTVDSVTRAMQSLCQNNLLGIIVNGAHRGELYSKFTYYHSYYYAKPIT